MSLGFKKRGNTIIDGLTIAAVLLVISVFGVVVYDVFGDINNDIQNDPKMNKESKDQFDDLHERFPAWLDGAFAIIMVFLWIAVMTFAFFIDNHPAFFWIGVLLLIIAIVMAMVFANVYEELMAEDTLSGLELKFPIINFVMNHLLESLVVIIFSVIIVLYGKSRSGGGL